MALTPLQKHAVWKSTWHLAVLVLGLVLAIYFNKPLAKDLQFDIPCREFIAPAPLQMNLHQSPTDVQTVAANGFDGVVGNVASLKFAQDSQPMRSVPPRSFTLARSRDPHQTPPDLEMTPLGDAGKVELKLAAGAVLKSVGEPGAKPVLSVESEGKGDVRLLVGSDRVTLHGNRYEIPEMIPGVLVKGFAAEAAGKFLVGVELISEAPAPVDADSHPPAKPSVNITLDAGPGQLPLIGAGGRKQDEVWLTSGRNPIDLVFTGSVNPDLRLDEKSVQGLRADHSVNLKIQFDSGRIEEIAINGTPEKRNAPTLNVKGSLRTHSVRQDGRELLPTVVEEVLSEPYSVRGPLLIIGGFVAFLVLKLVDRALNVLLEIYLPKGN